MSHCVLCNRTFREEKALKQHQENSLKHAETFGSHGKPRKDTVESPATPVSFATYVPLLFSTSSDVRSTTRNRQRSGHAATKNTSRTNSTFDLPFAVLQSQMQALTIPDSQISTVAPGIDRAHINTRQEETRTFFTFPRLHQRIDEAVVPAIASTWFNPDTEAHFDTEHETNVMGKFTCENKRCRKSQWSSQVVAVWIRGYPHNGYNAIVYNQRCKSCDRLGRFKLDEESYVERIAYRLKRWAGVRVEQPPFSGQSRGPHESKHCEGCKAGHCSRANS